MILKNKISPYVSTLTDSAIYYLLKEGLTMETIMNAQIGSSLTYGHETRRMLDDPTIERGVKTDTKAKPKEYPRFFNRPIMYPLINKDNEIVGYSGRATDCLFQSKYPKYLNSATTSVFKKSEFLYGENYIQKGVKLWIFEGQKDALLAQQLGLMAVAPLGKITPQQIAKVVLMGITDIVIAGDNDLAGRKFNFAGGEFGEKAGLRVEIATLPKNYNDLGDGKGEIQLEEFTITPFFNWTLDSIANLKHFTRKKMFDDKLRDLPWENASISTLKKHSWIDNYTYSRITNKYYSIAHRAIAGDTTYLQDREKKELEQDDFLNYLLNDMDYIIDDEIKEISYFHNKKDLTKLETAKYLWLVNLYLGNATPIPYPSI